MRDQRSWYITLPIEESVAYLLNSTTIEEKKKKIIEIVDCNTAIVASEIFNLCIKLDDSTPFGDFVTNRVGIKSLLMDFKNE